LFTRDFKDPKTGELLKEGDYIKFPLIADTMDAISRSKDPVKLFYDSDWTDLMVKEIQDNGESLKTQC